MRESRETKLTWLLFREKEERFSPLRESDKARVRGTVSNPGDQRDGGHQIWGKEVETADPNHNRDPCYSIAPSQQRITFDRRPGVTSNSKGGVGIRTMWWTSWETIHRWVSSGATAGGRTALFFLIDDPYSVYQIIDMSILSG